MGFGSRRDTERRGWEQGEKGVGTGRKGGRNREREGGTWRHGG